MSCASCHSPETGFSYPDSLINASLGFVPGAVQARFGSRKPPSLAYAPFLANGLPHYDQTAQAYVGGLFWDGRAFDAVAQVHVPLTNPVEMNLRDSEEIVRMLESGPSARLFSETFGIAALHKPAAEVLSLAARAIVAYETSDEVSPYTSKYDAYLEGKAELTPQELLGLRLTTGTISGRPDTLPFKKSAHCMDCHGASTDLNRSKDLWTNSCYANLGVPRNPLAVNEPDLGLGAFLYRTLGWPTGLFGFDDPLRIDGAFKAPSLRNVDKRPHADFVKCYMHNGVFKSLKEVVHFYNTRNLTTIPGEVIDFTEPNPYSGLRGKPLWPQPEYPSPISLINASGKAAGRMVTPTQGMDLDATQIGNLKLTDAQEDAIVAFLKTLSDGYFKR